MGILFRLVGCLLLREEYEQIHFIYSLKFRGATEHFQKISIEEDYYCMSRYA